MKKIGILTLLFIVLDLFTKYLAKNFLISDFTLIEKFFRFSYAENYGISFSFQLPPYLIFPLNLLILSIFVFFVYKEIDLTKPKAYIPSAMIIGGGLANLIDRAYNGFVIDFISILTYPTFNLADIFITLGVLFFVVFYGKILRISKIKNDRTKNSKHGY